MKLWIKIVIIIVILGIIGAMVVYKFIYNKHHPDYEIIQPDYTLTAKEVYDGFKRSPDGSSRLYNGKILLLTGKLSKIERSDTLVTAVFVFNQGDFGDEGVRCTVLKKFNGEAERLQPDGEISIKGFCTGYNDTDVILEKCSIIIQ